VSFFRSGRAQLLALVRRGNHAGNPAVSASAFVFRATSRWPGSIDAVWYRLTETVEQASRLHKLPSKRGRCSPGLFSPLLNIVLRIIVPDPCGQVVAKPGNHKGLPVLSLQISHFPYSTPDRISHRTHLSSALRNICSIYGCPVCPRAIRYGLDKTDRVQPPASEPASVGCRDLIAQHRGRLTSRRSSSGLTLSTRGRGNRCRTSTTS
jgi:hypothetical protein